MSERKYVYYASEQNELFTLAVRPSRNYANKVHTVYVRIDGEDHVLIKNVFYIGKL